MPMKLVLGGGWLVISALSLGACRSDKPAEGPAERAGKTVDKGVAAVGHGVEKTGQAIEGTAKGH